MLSRIKSVFYPDCDLSKEMRLHWERESRESYISSTNQFLAVLAGLSVLHLILVDIPSGFLPLWVFLTVRIGVSVLAILAIILSKTVGASSHFKLPYIIALIALALGQIVLMYFEKSIPFFIGLTFLIFSPIMMSLSVGFSFLAASLLFAASCPLMVTFLPSSSVPVSQQLLSNFIIVVFVVCGFRTRIYKDIHIFKLKSKNDSLVDEIVKKEKLVTIGIISAGLNHEVGNALSGVAGAADLLQILAEKGKLTPQSVLQNANQIKEATKRAYVIIDGLKVATHHNNAILSEVSLSKVVDISLDSLRDILSGIRVFKDITGTVKANETFLIQILINLIKNAVEAIHQDGDPQIKIYSHREGTYPALSVEDSGKGIPVELGSKVFEPLFTTKDVGKGTGLGLHICRTECEKINADLTYLNTTKSTFTITFRGINAD